MEARHLDRVARYRMFRVSLRRIPIFHLQEDFAVCRLSNRTDCHPLHYNDCRLHIRVRLSGKVTLVEALRAERHVPGDIS